MDELKSWFVRTWEESSWLIIIVVVIAIIAIIVIVSLSRLNGECHYQGLSGYDEEDTSEDTFEDTFEDTLTERRPERKVGETLAERRPERKVGETLTERRPERKVGETLTDDTSEVSPGHPEEEVSFKFTNYPRDSHGERACRRALEELFQVPFITTRRLPWLKNPKTGRNLELDCYNEQLALACEYNGYQHYVYPNIYHRTEEDFEKQQYRDNIKRELCDANGVYLITVPHTVNYEDIKDYIIYYLPENRKYRIDNNLTSF